MTNAKKIQNGRTGYLVTKVIAESYPAEEPCMARDKAYQLKMYKAAMMKKAKKAEKNERH